MAGQPTLREQQVDVTRTRILDALAELISEGGVDDFSVQDVADRAGVSHRTVYRHFEDRAALLDGLTRWLDDELRRRVGQLPTREGLVAGIRPTWDMFEDLAPMMESLVMLTFGAGVTLPRRNERTTEFRALVQDALDHLEPDDQAAAMGVIRLIASSTMWYAMRREFEVDGSASRTAVEWALTTLLADLRSGGGPGRSGAPTQDTATTGGSR